MSAQGNISSSPFQGEPGRRRSSGTGLLARIGALLAWMVLVMPFSTQAQRPASEERVVSSFLLNCLYYGRWAPPMDWESNKVARIGILGKDTLGDTLRAVADDFQSKRFKDGQIIITNSLSPADLADCHVVYVAETSAPPIGETLAMLAGRPVMLVSSGKGFAELGGMIELHLEPGKPPRWDLNLDRLRTTGILLGSPMKLRATAFVENGVRTPNPSR